MLHIDKLLGRAVRVTAEDGSSVKGYIAGGYVKGLAVGPVIQQGIVWLLESHDQQRLFEAEGEVEFVNPL